MSPLTTIEKRLVDRLEQTQVLSSEQIALVQELQRESAVSLAQALVELDLLSQSEVERIVSSIQEAKFVRLEDVVLDREAIRHIPARVARLHRCIPVRRSVSTLVIACADPQDSKMHLALSNVTDCELVYVTSDPDALEHAIYIHYGPATSGAHDSSKNVTRSTAGSRTSWQITGPWAKTFGTFVEHEGSARVCEAMKQLAAARQWDACPVLIVGEAGSGKSHLLAALTEHVTKHEPLCRYLSVSGRELWQLIREYSIAGRTDYLRFELRDRDLVVLDDVGDCIGDNICEMELAEWLQVSRDNGVRFVIAISDEDLLRASNSEVLRGQLSQGLRLSVSRPDKAVLETLLRERVRSDGSDDLAKYCHERDLRTWNEMVEAVWEKRDRE